MSPFIADIIGLTGSALFIGAFTYANFAKNLDKVLFNVLNLVGAALLVTSLWVNFNLAAFVLEIAWAFVALIGLITALRSRSAKP